MRVLVCSCAICAIQTCLPLPLYLPKSVFSVLESKGQHELASQLVSNCNWFNFFRCGHLVGRTSAQIPKGNTQALAPEWVPVSDLFAARRKVNHKPIYQQLYCGEELQLPREMSNWPDYLHGCPARAACGTNSRRVLLHGRSLAPYDSKVSFHQRGVAIYQDP